MKSKGDISIGDLVCFDGDEEGLILGVGLVVDVRGTTEELLQLDMALKDYYDEDEFWRLTNILPDAPMVLVLWSRSPTENNNDFELYNSGKVGYSFMWVYPTEISVIGAKKEKKDGK
jgi:hypothetical protein